MSKIFIAVSNVLKVIKDTSCSFIGKVCKSVNENKNSEIWISCLAFILAFLLLIKHPLLVLGILGAAWFYFKKK